jgi:acetylornithine deacetylase/succinyl-diaminopimelate desuccinylase-like protein
MMSVTADLEGRIRDQVEQRRAESLELLNHLLRASRAGEQAMQAIVEREFQAAGFETDVFEADLEHLRDHPEFSLLSELAALGTKGRPNVVARLAGDPAARSLFVFAHIDSTVLDPAGWNADPFAVTMGPDGRAYGYGIADDRSGIAGMILAARALAGAGVRPRGTVTMASCLGKHLGAGGTLAVMDRGYGGDAAVYLHPAETGAGLTEYKGFSLGLVQFRVSVPGRRPVFREQHQTPVAHQGANAIARAATIIAALTSWDAERGRRISHPALEDVLGRSTNLNITRIDGGDDDRKVPERCVFSGMVTFPPDETVAEVRRSFELAVYQSAAAAFGDDEAPTVEWLPLMAHPAANAADDEFSEQFAVCVKDVTGQSPVMWPAHTASDIRYPIMYAKAPTIGFGPRAGNIGGPNEWLDVDDFLRAVTILALLTARWCGTEPVGEG